MFRYVSNIVRQNTTNLIVGSPFPNRKELNKIAEEFGDVFGGPQQFLKVYALCTPERYDFMHCDLQANPPLAYSCFSHVVAEGDKIPRKGGPAITRSELLVINKVDLAPYVGADLSVMESDATRVREGRPFYFTNLRNGDGADNVANWVLEKLPYQVKSG